MTDKTTTTTPGKSHGPESPPGAGGPAPLGRRWWIGLTVLLAVGLLQQILILGESWRQNPFTTTPVQDAEMYWDWAGEIAAGQLLGTTPFMSAPLYPYLLGMLRALGGGLLSLFVLQAALHLATLALLVQLGARRFTPAVGLLMGVLFVLLTEPAFYTGRVLNCTLQLFLIVLLWRQLLAAQRRPTVTAWATVGALTGLNCLANPPMLLALVLIGLWALWTCGLNIRGLTGLVAHAAVAALVISPATWHNYKVSGEFIPISAQAGVTFAQGNAPDAEGTYKKIPEISGTRFMQNLDARRYYRETTGTEGGWNDTSRFFFRRGLNAWRDNPGLAARLFQLKLYWFVTGRVYGDIYFPTFEIREGFADALRTAPLPLAWVTAPAIIALLMLARSSLRRYTPELLLFLVPLLVVAFFWYSPRYRFPAAPVLVGAAAWAFWQLWQWRKDQRGAVIIAGALIVGVYLTSRSRIDRLEQYGAACNNAAAVVFARAGDIDAAIRYAQKAVEEDPEDTAARANLGLFLARRGDSQESLEQLRRAVVENPESPETHEHLGRALAEAGRHDEALSSFEEAVRLNPDNPAYRANLANALVQVERLEEAIEQYRTAVRIDPSSARVHTSLARLLLNRGDRDEGLKHLTEAVRFDPSLVDAHLLIAQTHLDRQELPETIAALRKAQALKQDDAELSRKLAWLLATTPDLSSEDYAEALRLARAAVQATPRRSPVFIDTLAAALAAAGEFDEAARTIQQLIAMAEQAGQSDAAAVYRERLELYQSGRPYIRTAP